jgi:hypothetical protein
MDQLGLKAKPGGQFKKRGWIKMHYHQRETEELRALAQCKGITLPMLLRSAMLHIKRETEQILGISGFHAERLSRAQRAHVARTFGGVNSAVLRQGFGDGRSN